jgi:hypothetical protein
MRAIRALKEAKEQHTKFPGSTAMKGTCPVLYEIALPAATTICADAHLSFFGTFGIDFPSKQTLRQLFHADHPFRISGFCCFQFVSDFVLRI